MIVNRVAVQDELEAGLDRTVTPPNHPCSVCGRETLEHAPLVIADEATGEEKVVGRRICSAALCRHVTGGELEEQ